MIHRLSLQARLLLLAVVTILTTLALTGWMIQQSVSETIFIIVNAKMDAQIEAFSTRPATLADDPARSAFLVDFRGVHPKWGWRIDRGDQGYRSGVVFGSVTPDTTLPDLHRGIASGSSVSARGERLHVRSRRSNGELIEIAAPATIVSDALRTALRQTLLRVSLVTLGLILAAWLALRRVLRPLRALRDDVASIRGGSLQRLPGRQPPELSPLAAEINALMDQNDAGLANARKHVANLAHGLKTPLATLALRQVRDGASTEARAMVADLDRRVEHHLGRARAGAFKAGGLRTRTDVGEVADTLVRAMQRLYGDRGLALIAAVAPGATAAADRQDLDEMLGNLLDNACRHARGHVAFTAGRDGSWVVLSVDDDGLGIPAEDTAAALEAGVRLDESGSGHGFGLSICRELAELYGGDLQLSRSSTLGGLGARLRLPSR